MSVHLTGKKYTDILLLPIKRGRKGKKLRKFKRMVINSLIIGNFLRLPKKKIRKSFS